MKNNEIHNSGREVEREYILSLNLRAEYGQLASDKFLLFQLPKETQSTLNKYEDLIKWLQYCTPSFGMMNGNCIACKTCAICFV